MGSRPSQPVALLKDFASVLVTGGFGFIGRHLVGGLLEAGKEVAVLDRAKAPIDLAGGTASRRVDIRRPRHVREAIGDAEIIFHLAANASGSRSVTDPRRDFETNAFGTFNVAEAAARSGVRRFVYVSSASVYGRPSVVPVPESHPTRPFLPYGASKLAGELASLSLFSSWGLPVLVARPFCVYGPGEDPGRTLVEVSRYLRWHLNSQPIQVVGDQDRKTRDFIHVGDVASALVRIAEAGIPGDIYNVGSGEEVSMRELIDGIAVVTDRRPKVAELAEITDDSYRLVAQTSKLRALGWRPTTPLSDGIGQLADLLGDRPALPAGETIFRLGQHAERT
jgi:UDP-glucose 4-epimerase